MLFLPNLQYFNTYYKDIKGPYAHCDSLIRQKKAEISKKTGYLHKKYKIPETNWKCQEKTGNFGKK